MTSSRRNTIFGALLIAGCWLATQWSTTTAQQPQAPTWQTWEYRTQDASAISDAKLNSLGVDGWELVTVAHTRSDEYLAVFKRPKR
jgi:hypothetical protein